MTTYRSVEHDNTFPEQPRENIIAAFASSLIDVSDFRVCKFSLRRTVCSITMGTRLDAMAGGEDQSAARGRCIWRLAMSSLGAARNAPSREEALFMILDDAILAGQTAARRIEEVVARRARGRRASFSESLGFAVAATSTST